MDKSHHLRVSLSLWGNHLKPLKITDILKLEPGTHWEKGYIKELSSGKKTAPRELGIWVFDIRQPSSIEDGLGELLRELNNRKLKEIEGVELAIIDIYLGLSDDNSFLEKSYEFRIDNAQLQQLAHLGVDVRITVT